MADQRPFAALSQQETQEMMLLLLSQILDKLPRMDANDRLMVNMGETTPAGVTAVQTGAGSVIGVQTLGSASREAGGIPAHIANMGAKHLYDNIKVS